jgi:hypothetical protein
VFSEYGGDLASFVGDQTPQQIAGPTSLENIAYRQQQGLLNGPAPQLWNDAAGMFSNLGNLPGFAGADFSNISGWGQPQMSQQSGGPMSMGMSQMRAADSGGFRADDPGADYGAVADDSAIGGSGGGGGGGGSAAATAAAMGLDPTQAGGSARGQTWTPVNHGQGGIRPKMVDPNMDAGQINAGSYGGPQGGQVREVDVSKYGRIGGGGGGGGFSFSSGGAGKLQDEARIDSVLDKIDFANHPALQSALDTFTKTALPGIENNMIGAGLGRSGAAANAISTGKAQIALPVMQQLIQGELTQRGQDVTQRGQDVSANVAAMNAARQAQMQGASLAAQRQMAQLAAEQNLRQQDISLRGQDINAALQNAGMGLQGRQQDIQAMIAGAGGLADLGQADLNRIYQNISGGMNVGGTFRDMQNQQNEAEFNAANRPYERLMQLGGLIAPGAMDSGGTNTTTVSSGGGK